MFSMIAVLLILLAQIKLGLIPHTLAWSNLLSAAWPYATLFVGVFAWIALHAPVKIDEHARNRTQLLRESANRRVSEQQRLATDAKVQIETTYREDMKRRQEEADSRISKLQEE